MVGQLRPAHPRRDAPRGHEEARCVLTGASETDLHFHILPGLDDGPATEEQALALARAATGAGTGVVAATVHVDRHHRVAPEGLRAAVTRFNATLSEAGVDLEVVPGAEIALDRLIDLSPPQLALLALGAGRHLLVEAPLSRVAGEWDWPIRDLLASDRAVLLAHPERAVSLRREPERLLRLVDEGALVQVTAGSMEGRFGAEVKLFARDLLRAGVVHNVASDAHDLAGRPPGLDRAREAMDGDVPGLHDRWAWYTREVPSCLVEGAEVPPAP